MAHPSEGPRGPVSWIDPCLNDLCESGSNKQIQLFCKTKVLGPEFQKLRKKKLVDPALSWFKVLRATSMNQKFPYILRISERRNMYAFRSVLNRV